MKAIHINSTAPFAMRHPGENYQMEDFDVLSTILSALLWRRFNGEIKLYTDTTGLEYYRSIGITGIWDGGIDTKTLDSIPDTINQDIFWAGAKIFALANEPSPVTMIDTDMLVWGNIDHILSGQKIVVFHREDLMEVYPPFKDLKKREGYLPDPRWDFTVLPCNTALAYFNDQDLLDYYTESAIDFMRGNSEYAMEMVTQMVFAEQRILGMCANAMEIPVGICLNDPFQENNRTFSHIWGGKNTARSSQANRAILCKALISKIRAYGPDFKPESPWLKEVFAKYERNLV